MHVVIGSDGVIGGALLEELENRDTDVLGTSRRRSVDSKKMFLDLRDPSTWVLPDAAASVCIAAAETSLEACRNDPQSARSINLDAPIKLAEKLVGHGKFVVLLSTNLIFDGSVPLAAADSPPSPRTEYGRQKAELEQQALALSSSLVSVVRLTKVISSKTGVLSTWLQKLTLSESVEAFMDYYLAPVALSQASAALSQILERRLPGISQLSSNEQISYADFARHLARSLGRDESLVHGVSYKDSNLQLEYSPRYPSLDASRIERELGLKTLSPREMLDVAMQE